MDERPKDDSGKKGKQSQAKKVANLSPQGLLAAKAQAQREAKEHAEQAEGVELNVHPISPATSASHGASKESSVLIEDITDGPAGATTQAHVEAKTTTSASQTQPQSKPKSKAVKKGFLQGKNAPRLYSDSGSENGAKEGSYSRLMSKCKVVDMSSMTPEEQEKAMREHGRPKGGPHGQMPTSVPGPPQATAPAATSAPAPPAQPVDDGRASFQGLGSGFLDGLGSKRKPLYGSKAKDNDDLFDSLVAGECPCCCRSLLHAAIERQFIVVCGTARAVQTSTPTTPTPRSLRKNPRTISSTLSRTWHRPLARRTRVTSGACSAPRLQRREHQPQQRLPVLGQALHPGHSTQ